MKWKILTFLLVPFFSATYAQDTEKVQEPVKDSIVYYTVSMGETIMLVAKKFHITPKDIYLLNPDAVNGLRQSMVLQLPGDKIRIPEQKKRAKPVTAVAASTD